MFKKFVIDNRPQLKERLDEIATGEVWHGTDAVQMGLCDDIQTADQLITEHVHQGWQVYELHYKPPQQQPTARGMLPDWAQMTDDESNSSPTNTGSLLERGIRWFTRIVASELTNKLAVEAAVATNNSEPKFSARYDGADRVRM